MQIRLHITKEKADELTWSDFIALEEAQSNNRVMTVALDMISGFLVGANGEYVSREMGKAYLLKLKRPQMIQTISAFQKAVHDYAVNPTNGDNSSSP